MWDNIRCMDSSDKSVSKFVFESKSAVAEAVLYQYPTYHERTVICCSVQSGCPVGCTFCGTGNKFIRNLSYDEILSQIEYVLNRKKIHTYKIERFQIMFMSMGEPFLNQNNLFLSLKYLNLYYPEAELLISTIGPDVWYKELYDISASIPQIGLQFSIHESTDEARDKLIPFERKLSLAEIAEVGDEWSLASGNPPFFNYCAHEGNTSDEDIGRLIELFDPNSWKATISVICEKDETIKSTNERQALLVQEFADKLSQVGYDVRAFNPAGQDDIGGGCGQLWYVQEWMKNGK